MKSYLNLGLSYIGITKYQERKVSEQFVTNKLKEIQGKFGGCYLTRCKYIQLFCNIKAFLNIFLNIEKSGIKATLLYTQITIFKFLLYLFLLL